MASTYSDLKIELIGSGEQTGIWGDTTNTNFSVAFNEAIAGTADVPFSSADVTLELLNTNASQTARNVRLNLTGTAGGARNLYLGSGCHIEKPYIINNGLSSAVTVVNSTGGTGVVVPAGKTMWVFNTGTNVVEVVTHAGSMTLGSALPIASGGTGSSSTTYCNLGSNVNGVLPIGNGGTAASSAADARTNLGLGTIATQNANNVNITGGSITGMTLLQATEVFNDGGWAIQPSGTTLNFSYNGAVVATLTSAGIFSTISNIAAGGNVTAGGDLVATDDVLASGDVVAAGDVTAYGTP